MQVSDLKSPDAEKREMAAMMLDAVKQLSDRVHRIQAITRYESEAYLRGKRIVDVFKAADGDE